MSKNIEMKKAMLMEGLNRYIDLDIEKNKKKYVEQIVGLKITLEEKLLQAISEATNKVNLQKRKFKSNFEFAVNT